MAPGKQEEVPIVAYGGDKGDKPPFDFTGFHHIEFYVSNAKQVADFYIVRMGFEKVGYCGLETGNRAYASHVVRQNKITYVFTSPLNPSFGPEAGCGHIAMDIAIKGDAAKDVAFEVDDARAAYKFAIDNGATGVKEPYEVKDDNGTVVMATLETYGKCRHTLITKKDYNGFFLPGFKEITGLDPVGKLLPDCGLEFIDHIVGNQGDKQMEPAADWYKEKLGFHRFWSVDDKQVHTQYSSLRSIVMADYNEVIKMPLNEPAKGNKKSQIQEYVDYHGGAGVQHIAMRSYDIIKSITNMKARGVEFLTIPAAYYDHLRNRLAKSKITVKEDIDVLQKLSILVDFDEEGYLLQLFTKPVEDRPTLFYEVIQREKNQGFGVGNFKALFESIELAQQARGNL